MIGRNWCQIDLGAIKRNYLNCKEGLLSGQKIMAVVKANAYGHGGVQVAKALQDVGCNSFAVASVAEGVELRRSGVKGQILVLGYTPPSEFFALCDFDLSQTVFSREYALALKVGCGRVKAHIAIDTGMNRIGFDCGDIDFINDCANWLCIEGVYTHFAVADDENNGFTNFQIKRFKKVLSGLSFGLQSVHCANSKGFQNFNGDYANTVRLGACLYGLGGCDRVEPALTWKSVVVASKEISAGESIGYGRVFVAKNNMKIATIACGYADGYSRGLSNLGHVVINGEVAPVVGRVCMDMMMVDISEVGQVSLGDEAVLLGEKYSAKDMASALNTIDYEVVTRISSRVERVYI